MKAKTQEEFKKKWVGVVEAITGEKVVKFTSIESYKDKATGKEKIKAFPDGTTSQKFDIADLPALAKRVIKPGMKKALKFRIRLNQDGDEVEMVTPVSGMFSAKLAYLGPKKEGEDPAPYEKFYNKGQPDENSHLEFFASYEITEGVFKGVELPAYFLHYKFEGIPEGEEDEGMTRFDTVDTPNASQLHRLQDWASVHGDILDEPITWPDDGNILPELEERAMEADRDVNVIIEKGYIKTVQAQENYETVDDEELDEVDEAFPPTDSIEEIQETVPALAKLAAKTLKSKEAKKPATKKLVSKHSDPDDEL